MKKNSCLLVTFVILLFGLVPFLSTTPSTHAEALPSPQLLSQSFNVTTATQIRFVFKDSALFANNPVEVKLHRRIASRRSFQAIALGQADSGVLDTLRLSPQQIAHNANGSVLVTAPLSQTQNSTRSLFIAFDGVYPISIHVVDKATNKPLAEVLTFINVRRTSDSTHDVQATTLIRLKAAPSLQTDGTLKITDETRARVQRFIEVLQNRKYPLTVSVQPEIIESLATSTSEPDQQLFVLLREQLRMRSITTSLFLPTDPSMFVAMNMREEFIEQLRVGEDTLNTWLPGVAIQRSTYIADHFLTTDGLQLLRTAGVVSVILMPRAQQKITVSRTSSVVMRPNGLNNNSMALVAVDADVSQTVANNTEDSSSALAAYRGTAELLVARDDLLASGHSAGSIRLVLATPNGDPSTDSSLTIAADALHGAPGIRTVDMATPQSVQNDSSTVRFSSMTPNTGAARAAGIAVARKELNATASMATTDDGRRELWSHLFAMGVSNTVINGDAYIAGLRDQLAKVRSSVTVTTPGTITLSGRKGAIRIQIRNNSNAALTVRVRMSSAKLNLQEPVRLVELAAGGTTEVKIEAGTRSNGRFPISIRVTTPEGNLEVVPYIQITARMNAIAGFGQYLSLFLLVLVLVWWWTHWRRTRSQRVGETTVSD